MSQAIPAAASGAIGLDLGDPLYDLLFNQSPHAVGVVEWLGDDVRFLEVNEVVAARFGRTPREVRGCRARDLGAPADVFPQLAVLVAEAMRRGGPAELEWCGSMPGRRHFRTVATPVPSPVGHPPRFAYLTEEVTQLRSLELRLGKPKGQDALARDAERLLAQGLDELDLAGEKVEAAAVSHPELELDDAGNVVREGLETARRAYRRLRQILRS